MATYISLLRRLEGVSLRPSADEAFLDPQNERGMAIPPLHQELLRNSNGLEVFGGYFRLFGIGDEQGIDALRWNQQDCWKFAWQDRSSEFWCFGETAWGDQYAYEMDSLTASQEPPVYLLDALSMSPEPLSNSFADFFESEFLRVASQPYDEMICAARSRFGPLDINQHLVYMPSLLLGGTEIIDHVQVMNARAAMICNGDVAIQLDNGPANGHVAAIGTYQDEQDRVRIRLEWA